MHQEYATIIERDEEWFIAYAPEVTGANGQGKTQEEALESLSDAITMILEDQSEGGIHAEDSIQRNAFLRGLAAIWRLPRMLLVGVVRLYRMGISPYFPSTCRYTPTCSEYAIIALKEYGALRGAILTTWRILRCNPWGGHGHDPPAWFGEKIEMQEVTDES